LEQPRKNTPKNKKDRLAHGLALASLILATIFFFQKAITFSGALFSDDLILLNLPARHFFFKNILTGNFPLWCPGICGGFPFFAEGQLGPLYLPNYLLFTWLPHWIALNITVVLHSFIAVFGMYYFLRQRHLPLSAATGAIAYAFCGYQVFHLVHIMLYQSACLFPWMFFFFDRYLQKGRKSDLLFAGLILGAMFTTGHQQGPIYCAMALGIYGLILTLDSCLGKKKKRAAKIFVAVFIVAAISAAATAVIIYSMFDLLSLSIRKGEMARSFIYSHSLVPDILVRLFSPDHHGRWMDMTWWLYGYGEKEMGVYLGLGAFLMAPLAFVGKMTSRDKAHLGVFLFGLLFILGSAGPFEDVIKFVPLLKQMRNQIRFTLPMFFALAFLMATGLDNLQSKNISGKKIIAFSGGGLFIWTIAAWGGYLATFGNVSLPGESKKGEFLESCKILLLNSLSTHTAIALALFSAIVIIVWVKKKEASRLLALMLIILLLVFADLSIVGRNENPVTDPKIYEPTKMIKYLRTNLNGGRIYTTERDIDTFRVGGWYLGTKKYAAGINALPGDTPLFFDMETIACDTPLVFHRTRKVLESINNSWLLQLGVKYILSTKNIGKPDFVHKNVKAYRVENPEKKYSLAGKVIPVADQEEGFLMAGNPHSDPKIAYVENFHETIPPPLIDESERGVKIEFENTDFRKVKVNNRQDGFLIIRESYHRAWKVFIDGQKVNTYRANYLFFGVVVPAGSKEIVIKFSPSWFYPLLAFSMIFFFGTLAIALFYGPFRKSTGVVVNDEKGASKTLVVILALFLVLLLIAVIRHPQAWSFAGMGFEFPPNF